MGGVSSSESNNDTIFNEIDCECSERAVTYSGKLRVWLSFELYDDGDEETDIISYKIETCRPYNIQTNDVNDIHPLCLIREIASGEDVSVTEGTVPDNETMRALFKDLVLPLDDLYDKYSDHHVTDTRSRIIGFIDNMRY